jgi:hypothetical protein
MSEAELIFTALAELSTRQIAETVQAIGMPENAEAGRKGGGIAKKARRELEQKTGRSIVTGENFPAVNQATTQDWREGVSGVRERRTCATAIRRTSGRHAGIPVFHFPVKRSYAVADIRAALKAS